MTPNGRLGHAQGRPNLIMSQAGEIAEPHDLGLQWVLTCQSLDGFMDGEHGFIRILRGQGDVFQQDALAPAAAAQTRFGSSPFDQNSPHGLGCGGEKMRAILPGLAFARTGQAEPGFMDQRGRLEGLARPFVRHFLSGQFAEFLIHQREEFLGRFGIALFNALEDLGDIAHATERKHPRGFR